MTLQLSEVAVPPQVALAKLDTRQGSTHSGVDAAVEVAKVKSDPKANQPKCFKADNDDGLVRRFTVKEVSSDKFS